MSLAAARYRLIIADDHAMVREGLRGMVSHRHDVVGCVGTGAELLGLLPRVAADGVLLDFALPDRTGLDLLPDILALRPGIKVIVVTMHLDRVIADAVLDAGAHGFVPKDSDLRELLEAIDAVQGGRRYVSHRVPRYSNKVGLGATHALLARLTPRQHEIIQRIGRGETSVAIARALGVTERTVVFHRARIRKALGLQTEWELLRYAILAAAGGESERSSGNTPL